MNKIKTACALVLILALSACGGGGGSSSAGGGGGRIVNFPPAPGADSTTIITDNTLIAAFAALTDLGDAISDDSIAAPESIPSTGQATLKGYVSVDGTVYDAVGHLTITADFSAGSVETRATGFREFDTRNPATPVAITNSESISGGLLTGSGTIDRTTITSRLDGDLYNGDGDDIDVLSAFVNGKVYDNGDDTLVVAGEVAGTTTYNDGTPYPFDFGVFAASE